MPLVLLPPAHRSGPPPSPFRWAARRGPAGGDRASKQHRPAGRVAQAVCLLCANPLRWRVLALCSFRRMPPAGSALAGGSLRFGARILL